MRFVNAFGFEDIKRFYIIEDQPKGFVRAWQGHLKENKYLYITRGEFLICAVEIDDWEKPSESLPVSTFFLSHKESKILIIPGGNANGIQALRERSQLLIFSNMSLSESKVDEFRFPDNWWYNWDLTN